MKPKPKTYSQCPDCGLPLEATAKFYLSDVEIDNDGRLVDYRLAFDDSPGAQLMDSVEELDIYCGNDHPFDLARVQRLLRLKARRESEGTS